MIRLQSQRILDYYDVPILFVAKDVESEQLYVCSFVNFTEEGMLYIATHVDGDQLDEITARKGRIAKVFKRADKVFTFLVNQESTDIIEAVLLEEDVEPYLPSSAYYIDPIQEDCHHTQDKYELRSIDMRGIDLSKMHMQLIDAIGSEYFDIHIPVVPAYSCNHNDQIDIAISLEEMHSCQNKATAA